MRLRGMIGIAIVLTSGSDRATAAEELSFQPFKDHAVVSLPGSIADGVAIRADGGKLVLALSSPTKVTAEVRVSDPTVRRIGFLPGHPDLLAITLNHGRSTTERIAAEASIAKTPDGIQISFPRKQGIGTWKRSFTGSPGTLALSPAGPQAPQPAAAVISSRAPGAPLPAGVTAVATPEPPSPQQPVAAIAPVAPTAVIVPPPVALRTPAKSMKIAGPPAAAPLRLKAEDSFLPATAKSERTEYRGTLVFSAVILLGAGLAAFARHRKAGRIGTADDLEVVGARSLGGKNRVVLLRTRGRELLLGVSEKGVGLIDTWSNDDIDAAPRPAAARTAVPQAVSTEDRHAPSGNPLIAGLLKLRKSRKPEMNADVRSADNSDDALWMKELASATERKGAS